MTTTTFQSRIGKTGRPLGILDVLGKVVETAIGKLVGRNAEQPSAAALDAAAVRRMADREKRRSPGFAADLYAAADRHEREAAR